MLPAGPVLDEIAANLLKQGEDDMDEILRSLNLSYWSIATKTNWMHMRRRATVNFASADATENTMVFPADVIRIYDAWDSDGKDQFFQGQWGRTERDDQDQDDRLRWFYHEPVRTPLLSTDTVSLTKGNTTFTMTPAWSATYVGEYIRFGSEMGWYALTADKTFTPAYNGAGGDNMHAEIRPVGTPTVSIRNREGDFEAKTVYFYYWAYPQPICNSYDMILLPDTKCLELATMLRVLGEKDHKRQMIASWQERANKALSDAISLNPNPVSPRAPLSRLGRQVTMGKWVR